MKSIYLADSLYLQNWSGANQKIGMCCAVGCCGAECLTSNKAKARCFEVEVSVGQGVL